MKNFRSKTTVGDLGGVGVSNRLVVYKAENGGDGERMEGEDALGVLKSGWRGMWGCGAVG